MEVWVFNGENIFPSGVFSNRDNAERWISEQRLTGTLTKYPVDVAIYDWAITTGAFKPKRPDQRDPQFIARFTSTSLEHYHYTDGSSG